MKRFRFVSTPELLLNCIEERTVKCAHRTGVEQVSRSCVAALAPCKKCWCVDLWVAWFYWQASQPGSSMAQNVMSVAGVAFICACAAAAAVAKAVGAVALTVLLPGPMAETALSLPACTVDFSTCVADMVRR